jgi:hypothetical protein
LLAGDGLDDEYWAAVLRKHAHILDKGLQRQDCEPGHSVAHYTDALEALKHIQSAEMRDDPSVKWAVQRLEQYDALQQGRFSRPSMEPPAGDAKSYELLLQIIKQRRSVRSFQDRPVDRQTLQQVVESANWAPQSCNRQTVRVFAATDSDLVQACARTCRGATCFSGRACFLCFAADLRPYHLPEEMWLPMVDASLCAENCCLIAHTLGLSLTMLTWCQSDQEDEVQVRHLLGVPWYYRIVVNGLMGYPKGLGETPARKALGHLLSVRLPPQVMNGCDA